MRSEVGRKRLRRDELDGVSEDTLQEVAQLHEMVEGFLAGRKLDEEVDVATRLRAVASNRAEQGEPTHTEADDVGLGGNDACLHVGSRRGDRNHTGNLPVSVGCAMSR